MFNSIKDGFKLHTVASVTKEFDAIVARLKAIELQAAEKLDFHNRMVAAHAAEQAAAKRIGDKISSLVS